MKRPTVEQIKSCAQDRWLSILSELAPELIPAIERLGKHTTCPVHGGKDGFRMFKNAYESGGAICNTCGAFSDGIALLQWGNNWSFRQTIERLGVYLGLNGEGRVAPPLLPLRKCIVSAASQKDWSSSRKWLSKVWEETILDDGRIKAYMEGRGLSVQVPEAIRLHRGLRSTNGDGQREGVFHAMVARFLRDGEMVGLHVTYLDPDKPRKASVERPRKIWKCVDSISGSAIPLFPQQPQDPLILVEGIETALAVHELTNGQPVWACGNAVLLEHVWLPDSVRDALVASDKDANWIGQGAGERLARRLLKEGRVVRFAIPPIAIPVDEKGVDWLDVLIIDRKAVAHGE